MLKAVKTFAAHDIIVTPGGKWQLKDGKKFALQKDKSRPNYAAWSTYPEDNMGKHFLSKEQGIVIVDIDEEPTVINADGSIEIPALDVVLPKTFYTTTSQPNKFHLYYKAQTEELPNRLVKLQGTNVDIFTYGNIFDPHLYSPHCTLNDNPMATLPEDIYNIVVAQADDLNLSNKPPILSHTFNIQRYNLVIDYLQDKLQFNTEWNAFFRSVFPHEFIPKNSKKITFQTFEFSYDLLNKIATKLSTTRDLGTYEHTLPVLEKIVREYNRDPSYRQILSKQILGTLPETSPEQPYSLQDDALTLSEHIHAQPDTITPIFRVLVDGKVRFIELNRHSLRPVQHNNVYFLDLPSAKALHPERTIVSNEGKEIGWDDKVPIVYVTDSPYDPPLFVDADNNRSVINLYQQTPYVANAVPSAVLPATNIFYKLLQSSVHPDYREWVMKYHAKTVFSDTAPTTVLWIASMRSDKGGTGKSVITIDIMARLLGTAAATINEEDMKGSWGDVLVGARTISLEDLPNMGSKQFEKLYSSIKQATSSAQKRLNMKGLSFRTERINLAITGSSNERLMLNPSDRRFMCLEPAHLRGHTERLTREDALEIEAFRKMRSTEFYEPLQEYANYLLYLHQGFNKEDEFMLDVEAPETPYRTKWISSGQTNTQNLVLLFDTPEAFHSTVRVDELSRDMLIELYELILKTYSPKTKKTALPWNWFREILPFVQSTEHTKNEYSKAQVEKMLGIDFATNVGTLYSDHWERKWKASGLVKKIDEDQLKDWQGIIQELKDEAED